MKLILEQLEDRLSPTTIAGVNAFDTILANGVHRLTIANLRSVDRVDYLSNKQLDTFYGHFGAYNIVSAQITNLHGQIAWHVTLALNDAKSFTFNIPWTVALLHGRRDYWR